MQGGILRATYMDSGRAYQVTSEVNLQGTIQVSVVDGVGTAGRLAMTLTDYDLVGRSTSTVRVARGGGATLSIVLSVVQTGGVRFSGYVDVVSNLLPGKKPHYHVYAHVYVTCTCIFICTVTGEHFHASV